MRRTAAAFFKNFLLVFLLSTMGYAHAIDSPGQRAKTIFHHLTGQILRDDSPLYLQLVELVKNENLTKVGDLAAKEASFIDSTVRLWASRMLTNEDPNLLLNDSLALLMGSVRDNLDARLLLTGDYTYGRDLAWAHRPGLIRGVTLCLMIWNSKVGHSAQYSTCTNPNGIPLSRNQHLVF
ncbi:MAG: hypothetical protein AABZ55_13730 [Bdellovibrionota bacterium]